MLPFSASSFFSTLTATNKLAQHHSFTFARVSGLDGFEEALQQMLSATALVAASDISQGYIELNNAPHTRRVKTIFLAMRHPIDDLQARQQCMDTMRELFRQFMSVFLLEKTRLEQGSIYVDPRITFNEIPQYFFSGAACAYFQIAIDTYTDLRYDNTEWL